MKKPTSIKFIIGFTGLQLVLTLFFVGLTNYLAYHDMATDFMRGVKVGYFERLGADPNKLADFEVGEVVGRQMAAGFLPTLMLIFTLKRKLLAMRIISGLEILVALGQFSLPIIPGIIFGLTLTKGARVYVSKSQANTVAPNVS